MPACLLTRLCMLAQGMHAHTDAVLRAQAMSDLHGQQQQQQPQQSQPLQLSLDPRMGIDPRMQSQYEHNNPVIYYVVSSHHPNMMMYMPSDGSLSNEGGHNAQLLSQGGANSSMMTMLPQQGDLMGQQGLYAGGLISADGMQLQKLDDYAMRPAPGARRADVPNCSACGATGKQSGRSGSRIKEGYCLCANCEDRAKRFKKDGLRKGVL